MIRDLSSGILKQFANVLAIFLNIALHLGFGFRPDYFARAAGGFNLLSGRSAEFVRRDRQLLFQLAIAEDLDQLHRAVGQSRFANRLDINARSVVETVQRLQIDRNVSCRVPGIVEAALWNAANQRHLAAFEADTNRRARARCLSFAAAAGSFAVTAGLALPKALTAVFGARTWFQIVQTHKIKSSCARGLICGRSRYRFLLC